MAIRIAHSAAPREGSLSHWDWEAWIEGDAAELDAIEYVEYRLHSSYPRSERVSKRRSSKFRISSYGWGEFRLRATVHLKDGSEENLAHWLSFGEAATEAGPALKRVFMSYAASDSRVAEQSRSALEAAGIKVRSPQDLKTGVPWELALRNAIEESDAMVVITPEIRNRAVDTEISIAMESQKPVIPLSFSFRQAETPYQLSEVQGIHIKDIADIPHALRDREQG